jgi:hypothetical protein
VFDLELRQVMKADELQNALDVVEFHHPP